MKKLKSAWRLGTEAGSGFVGAISGLFCYGAIIVGIVAMSQAFRQGQWL